MPDVLIYGDTVRSPELRHEVPLGIVDPFLYAERNGERHVVISTLELPRVRELGDITAHTYEEFGIDELIQRGVAHPELELVLALRGAQAFGIGDAVVPVMFPLGLADKLGEAGIDLRVDQKFFDERRRVKNDQELAGIRRAQRAAEAGMDAARELLRRAKGDNGTLTVDGEPLTSERLKLEIDRVFVAHGCAAEDFIVSHGAQTAVGHDGGSGEIAPGEPIVIDLWPRDRESACYADMTRTFVVGTPSDELAEWHGLVKEALDRALAETRAGASGRGIYDGTCEIFEQHGFPTQRTKEPGTPLEDGFFHGLGHGVGLEVHEQPGLGRASKQDLVAGDVVTLEPGLYRQGFGGVRLEDIVLVTEDGAENLTDYPYDLEP